MHYGYVVTWPDVCLVSVINLIIGILGKWDDECQAFIFGFTALLALCKPTYTHYADIMFLFNLEFSIRTTLPSQLQPAANSELQMGTTKGGTKQASIM